MQPTVQTRKIKCPYCGWELTYELQTDGSTVVDIVAGTATQAMRGVSQVIIESLAKIKEKLQDNKLQEANAWILIPACSNPDCKHSYEYNVKTGATRK